MNVDTNKNKKKKSKTKKVLTIISIVFASLLLVTGGFVYYFYLDVKETASKVTDKKQWNGSDKRSLQVDLKKGEPVSILLMGVDQRANDVGRSDSLMLVTLNPKSNSMNLLSIPRDSRTEIVGHGTTDKINHAYAFGGVNMEIKSVENFLNGVPVDYYVEVNMDSYKQIIDTLGGVTVNNNLAFSEGGYNFPLGQVSLNGDKSLVFTRMRYNDPRGDFGRTERQRMVVNAIVNQGAQVSNITKFNDLLKVLGNNVKTNLTFDDMNLMLLNYKNCRLNSQSYEIKGEGKMIDNIWYYIVSDQERQNISTKLKEFLALN